MVAEQHRFELEIRHDQAHGAAKVVVVKELLQVRPCEIQSERIYIDTLQSPLAIRVAFLKAMGDPFLGCADAIGMSSVAAGEKLSASIQGLHVPSYGRNRVPCSGAQHATWACSGSSQCARVETCKQLV